MEEELKITWSFSALEMLADLHEYISEEDEKAADKYIGGIYKSVEKLEKYPESCAPCRNEKLREEGYRCCKFRNHIIIYEFVAEEVNILAVIHSKRNPSGIKDILKDE